MTLYQFNQLYKKEQVETLWDKGVFIADRRDNECMYLLYQIDSFYVEVSYDDTHNTIRKFRSFSSVTQLEPYLNNIDINELNK